MKKYIKVTAIIKGEEIEVDLASERENDYQDIDDIKFLGKGKIHKVNGKKVEETNSHYFWKNNRK